MLFFWQSQTSYSHESSFYCPCRRRVDDVKVLPLPFVVRFLPQDRVAAAFVLRPGDCLVGQSLSDSGRLPRPPGLGYDCERLQVDEGGQQVPGSSM